MPKILLRPINETVSVPENALLLPILLQQKLNVRMSCGGNGLCSTCHVHVRDGMDNLTSKEGKERRTLAMVADAGPSSRLACQTRVLGDVELHIPEGMYLERSEDLVALIGTKAQENILDPITGRVLIPKGKLITRTLFEQSRSLDSAVARLRESVPQAARPPAPPASSRYLGTPGNGTWVASADSAVWKQPAPPTGTPGKSPTGVFDSSRRSGGLGSFRAPPSSTSVPVVSVTDTPPHPMPRPAAAPAPGGSQPMLLAPQTGDKVGRCLLLDCIGKGGAGRVFRALHTTLNITVAVKFILEESDSNDHFLGRSPESVLGDFRREARLLARLNHPNVVRVLDFEDSPPHPYVVMEFVEGMSLSELIQQTGRLRVDRALNLLLHVVDGLEALSKLGIVHRDVKPGNVLVSKEGMAKLLDFGLALQLSGEGHHGREGAIEGTVAYMSPEQIQTPDRIDHRADIYSLGVTLFQMLTGQLPFVARTRNELMLKQLHESIPPIHVLMPDVPVAVSDIVARMTAKNPEERFEDYPTLKEELTQLLAMCLDRGHSDAFRALSPSVRMANSSLRARNRGPSGPR